MRKKSCLKKSRTFLDCERIVFGWTFEKTSDVSRGSFLRKTESSKKIMSFSGLCRSFFRIFGRIVQNGCQNCTCVSRLHLEELFNLWKKCNFSLSFPCNEWFIVIFGWIFWTRFPKMNSMRQRILSRKNIGCEFFFKSSTVLGFDGKPFGLLTTTVQQCCQNCTICASGTKLGKNNFGKTY